MIADSPDVLEVLRRAESHLTAQGVPNARRNAEWMLSHVLECRSPELYLDAHRLLDRTVVEKFDELVQRRGAREPLQYILGSTEFMSLKFRTSCGVFIPRPDTEVLVEKVEAFMLPLLDRNKSNLQSDGPPPAILDLCCGTGVIVIALVRRNPVVSGVAVDNDPVATALTKENAALNGVSGRIRCIEADAVGFLQKDSRLYDVIVCNPPYIRSGEIGQLPPEIRAHEAVESLDGGPDGLDFYRRIVPFMNGALTTGGVVAFEIGDAQRDLVVDIMRAGSLAEIEIHQDYNGLDRVITGRKL